MLSYKGIQFCGSLLLQMVLFTFFKIKCKKYIKCTLYKLVVHVCIMCTRMVRNAAQHNIKRSARNYSAISSVWFVIHEASLEDWKQYEVFFINFINLQIACVQWVVGTKGFEYIGSRYVSWSCREATRCHSVGRRFFSIWKKRFNGLPIWDGVNIQTKIQMKNTIKHF